MWWLERLFFCDGNSFIFNGISGSFDFAGKVRGKYMGCFMDSRENRLLRGHAGQLKRNTPNLCCDVCYQRGYMYAGVEYGWVSRIHYCTHWNTCCMSYVRIHTLILTKSHDSVIFGRIRKFRRLFICLRVFPSHREEPSVTYFLLAKQMSNKPCNCWLGENASVGMKNCHSRWKRQTKCAAWRALVTPNSSVVTTSTSASTKQAWPVSELCEYVFILLWFSFQD